MSEYGVDEEDLKGGGGNNKAKPTGTYTAIIEKAEAKKDKNGKIYLAWRNRIAFGPLKNQIAFESYLPISREGNKYVLARRNSLVKAIGLKPGAMIPGSPGGPSVDVLNGAYIDFNLEHEYENVPGQDYSVSTRRGKLPDGVTEADVEGINPSERVTFYAVSDEFEGLADGAQGATPTPAVATPADEDWG